MSECRLHTGSLREDAPQLDLQTSPSQQSTMHVKAVFSLLSDAAPCCWDTPCCVSTRQLSLESFQCLLEDQVWTLSFIGKWVTLRTLPELWKQAVRNSRTTANSQATKPVQPNTWVSTKTCTVWPGCLCQYRWNLPATNCNFDFPSNNVKEFQRGGGKNQFSIRCHF